MPSSIDSKGFESQAVRKVLSLLEALRDSPAGSVIYQQVERMLEDQISRQSELDHAYQGAVQGLLDVMIRQFPSGSPEQVQLRLLRTRLRPPLSPAEFAAVVDYVERRASLPADAELDGKALTDAVQPLLAAFGIGATPATAPAPPGPVPGDAMSPDMKVEAETEAEGECPDSETRARAQNGLPCYSPVDVPEREAAPSLRAVHTRSEESGHDPALQELQHGLSQQVFETITQNQEFGVLLEIVETELRETRNISDLERLRAILVGEIEKLTKGHHQLAGKLDSTHKYLQVIESDSRELSDELSRVRLLSLTDELTSLPNRRAFLRRLEDEVSRVQRYGFPLSLALIDLDKFKEVNDQFGHAGGDEVLRVYSKNILSIFRHHDLVARYGGEEFAVLLANTDNDGARRALNKVKKRARETRWLCDGKATPVPTFSAGLALYKLGETTANFIERADKALYRAKRLGRDRVEVDQTFTGETPDTESADNHTENPDNSEN